MTGVYHRFARDKLRTIASVLDNLFYLVFADNGRVVNYGCRVVYQDQLNRGNPWRLFRSQRRLDDGNAGTVEG